MLNTESNTVADGTYLASADATPAEHLTGAHLAELLGLSDGTRIFDLLGDELGEIVVTWNVQTVRYGRSFPDYDFTTGRDKVSATGKVLTTNNPVASEVLAVPVALVEELLASSRVELPTREDCLRWAAADRGAGGDGTDPEQVLQRAAFIADPDLIGTSGPAERRVCGVPRSIFDTLEPHEQESVLAGKVIGGPNSPLAAARWVARRHFTTEFRVNGARGRCRVIRARTLIRVDQTWYEYARPGLGRPKRWIARTDPEWIGGILRRILGELSYLHTRRENKQNVYSVRWWNPTEKAVNEVEKALAGMLFAGSGTNARELPDAYGVRQRHYADSATWALCRNGVLDVSTGRLRAASPLWFSLTRIEADYNPDADPYADCRFLQTLRAQWADDPAAITCLQQWFGYVLSGRNDRQRWMMVLGPKGSAKSLIANVLAALVGNVAELGLDTLNSHFGLQQTYETGATLAVMSDMRFGGRDTSMALGRLLAITGGDTVDVARKYKASVSANLAIRFHGTANEMPRISDHSGALLSRMLVLHTTRVFRGTEDDDPGLSGHIMTNELGQVLRWAVDGLALLNAADGRFTLSATAPELLDEIADDMSNVRQFVGDCCEVDGGDNGHYVKLADLFRVWKAWAEETRTGERMSQNAFFKALRSYTDGNTDTPIRVGQTRSVGKVVHGVKAARFEVVKQDPQFGRTSRVVSTNAAENGAAR